MFLILLCLTWPFSRAQGPVKEPTLDESLQLHLSETARTVLQGVTERLKKNSTDFLKDPEKFSGSIVAALPAELRDEVAQNFGSSDASEVTALVDFFEWAHASIRIAFRSAAQEYTVTLEYRNGQPWTELHFDEELNLLNAIVIQMDQKFDRAEVEFSFDEKGNPAGRLELQRMFKGQGSKKSQPKVLIAVLDTDINYNHPSLRPFIYRPEKPASVADLRPGLENLWTLKKERTMTDDAARIKQLTSEIQKIRIELARRSSAWDFVEDDPWPNGRKGFSIHGTHVASILVKNANPDEVAILPLVSPHEDRGTYYEAVELAHALGARIVNLSRGSDDPRSFESFDQAFVNFADTLFVCSAGNSGHDVEKIPHFPGAFKRPNVIRVAALDAEGALAQWIEYGNEAGTNYGTSVQVAAPGVEVLGADADDESAERKESGSSMAAPFVSGIAGRMKAARPELAPEKIISILMETAQHSNQFKGKLGSGAVDAEKALAVVKNSKQ